MLDKKRIFLILALWNMGGHAFECPEGATLVEVVMPTDGSMIKFCQKNFEGKLLKHGPYQKTSPDGVILEESFFTQGTLGKAPPVKESVPKKMKELCETYKDNIRMFINPMANKEEGTHRRVVVNPDLCPGYPKERLSFIALGTPFNMSMKFKKKCYLQGSMKWEKDKKLHARFNTIPPFNVDSIDFDYKMTLIGSGMNKGFELKATNGEMKKKGQEGSVKFSFNVKVMANLIDLKTSRGREGLFTEEPEVVVSEVFGKKCEP